MFLDRLTQEDFVSLINSCTNVDMDFESMVESRMIVDFAYVSGEEDRKLTTGERYYWIRGVRQGDMPKYIGDYKATDFWMASSDQRARDYSNVLREFLARKFGEEYLDSLYEYHVSSALAERKALENTIGISR